MNNKNKPGRPVARGKNYFSDFSRACLKAGALLAISTWTAGWQSVWAGAEIFVNQSLEDSTSYVCWAPEPVRIRMTGADQSLTSAVVTVASSGSGVLGLQASNVKPTTSTVSASSSINVPVIGGEISGLWVMGLSASSGTRDASIIVRRANGSEIARRDMMIRVRKNAEALTTGERDAFLVALAQVHRLSSSGIGSMYRKHQQAHGEGFRAGIHGGPQGMPLFLAWHRSFLMHLERELQAIDPTVALPYWRFDEPAPAVFSEDFMGRVQGDTTNTPGALIVEWSSGNPIDGWQMFDGMGAMTRRRNGDTDAPIPSGRLAELMPSENYRLVNGRFESRYHNTAHSTIGGWLTTLTSPRDPLFFLLHANVDRAWAVWQRAGGRFDDTGTIADHYHATGNYPGSTVQGRYRKGSYANDRVWPWIPQGGDQGTADPLDDWPPLEYPMPAGNGTSIEPTPAQMVDYHDADGDGRQLGFCYDDVPFVAAPVTPNAPAGLVVE